MKWRGEEKEREGKREAGGGNAKCGGGTGVDGAASCCVECARWRREFSCKLVTWNVVVVAILVVVVVASPWEEQVESWTQERWGRVAATQATASSSWDIEAVCDDRECYRQRKWRRKCE